MESIPFSEDEADGFEQGCQFTLMALELVGVKILVEKLKSLLTEVVSGERTLLPSPSELRRKPTVGEDPLLAGMYTSHRRIWGELHRKYAAVMLDVISTE